MVSPIYATPPPSWHSTITVEVCYTDQTKRLELLYLYNYFVWANVDSDRNPVAFLDEDDLRKEKADLLFDPQGSHLLTIEGLKTGPMGLLEECCTFVIDMAENVSRSTFPIFVQLKEHPDDTWTIEADGAEVVNLEEVPHFYAGDL